MILRRKIMKKFSKLASLALAGVMAFSLAACSGDNGSTGTTTEKTETTVTEETTEVTDAADTTEATTEPAGDLGLKAGFICLHDENSTYDLNFINAAKEACAKLGVEAVIKTNIPEGQECYETAVDLADSGCDFVFADSFGHEDYMIQAAQEFPDVQFSHATGTKAHTENLDNFHNAFASIYDGRYLAGIAAGMKLNEMIDAGEITAEEAKIGYVGAFTYAEVVSGYTAFYLGVKSVCPTVTMEVTFTGSWYDETAEKTGAQTLIDNGCVLISQHADSMGAPTACETAGVPDVSYNGSTASACPNTFIVSSRINWAPYFEYCLNAIANGEAIDTDWCGSLNNGSVALTDLGGAAAEGTQDAIDEAEAKLMRGEIHVFDISTFTVDGAAVESYMADVDTDADYTPDHETVVEGDYGDKYIDESGEGLRSAPFFSLNIDGITLLDTAF